MKIKKYKLNIINKKIFSKLFEIILILILFLNFKKHEKFDDYTIKKEITLIKDYYRINNDGKLIKRITSRRIKTPKVSVVSSVYNREKYIPRFVRSVQNQKLNDVEIIFVDDCSDDNSVQIIEKYKKDDKRINLIKNKNNKGTLISRNIGALVAKGEFLIFPDSDDILSRDILYICYRTCKRNNYDLIRFNMYSDVNFVFSLIDNNLTRTVYQPELRSYLIDGYGYPKLVDGIISNKFVRKITFLIAMNNINEYYLNQKMLYFEDGLMNFALHLYANSLYLLNHIGYYYIYNDESVSHFVNSDSYLKCFFIFLKFIIENTKNNEQEKEIKYFFLKEYIYDNNILYNIINYSNIYEEVINSLINNEFISPNDLEKLKILKNIILTKKIIS